MRPSGRIFGLKLLFQRPTLRESNSKEDQSKGKLLDSLSVHIKTHVCWCNLFPYSFVCLFLSLFLSQLIFLCLYFACFSWLCVCFTPRKAHIFLSWVSRIQIFVSGVLVPVGSGSVVVWLTRRAVRRKVTYCHDISVIMTFANHFLYSPFFTTSFCVTFISANHDCANPFVLAQSLMWRILHRCHYVKLWKYRIFQKLVNHMYWSRPWYFVPSICVYVKVCIR